MTRSEHIRWCKERAREYLNVGDPKQAVASLFSDLANHEETADLVTVLGPLGMSALMFGDPLAEARRFVEGIME